MFECTFSIKDAYGLVVTSSDKHSHRLKDYFQSFSMFYRLHCCHPVVVNMNCTNIFFSFWY